MMETAHKNVLDEIKQSRVIGLCLHDDSDDFSSSAKQSDETIRKTRAKTEVADKWGFHKQIKSRTCICEAMVI